MGLLVFSASGRQENKSKQDNIPRMGVNFFLFNIDKVLNKTGGF